MYRSILKRAWEITWKYKILWLFGLFAGSMFGSSSRGTEYSSTSASTSGTVTQAQAEAAMANARRMASAVLAQAQLIYQQYAALIWLGLWIALLIVIGIVVVSVAARGGLVHLANEAEEGRPVKARDGWRVGFAKWWRVFGILFLAGLPVMVVGLVFSGALVAATVAWLNNVSPVTVGSEFASTFMMAFCGVLVVTIIGTFLGVMLGIASELGIRYAVINDRGALDSLKQGWRDLWSRRGAFRMFLVQLGVGILFAIVVGIAGSILGGPMVVVSTTNGIRVSQPASQGLTFLLIIPAAVFAAFYSAAWTVFFRRMTGMQPQPVTEVAPVPMPAPPAPLAPEAPAPPVSQVPAPPAPPAPPMSDV